MKMLIKINNNIEKKNNSDIEDIKSELIFINDFVDSYFNMVNYRIIIKDLDTDGDIDLLAGTSSYSNEGAHYFENVGVQQPVTYECIN